VEGQRYAGTSNVTEEQSERLHELKKTGQIKEYYKLRAFLYSTRKIGRIPRKIPDYAKGLVECQTRETVGYKKEVRFSDMTCFIEGCTRNVNSLGMCKSHYDKSRRVTREG
jgi:hypothetical protein